MEPGQMLHNEAYGSVLVCQTNGCTVDFLILQIENKSVWLESIVGEQRTWYTNDFATTPRGKWRTLT